MPDIGHFLRVFAVAATDGDGFGLGVAVKRGQVHGIGPPTGADHANFYHVACHRQLPYNVYPDTRTYCKYS